ncbi:putative MFS monocarboxylate transporter [Aspergillus clavatus NRRL 1]|uniref:MFS monocarboxylate transporter, putative n=1 Tax=Aspergillus clavatus (strain ATCC 1007 / CBS 513.65 / DSM 816 / NCTC 3887 / NRRL 1 / QM 1276 / 107) TaxID=344612 RepID=A1CT87_ASPCL|nr:MFS monocarboxylate transporter, putative [Aspergillus clavatus NRRL 1]EAW06524.1 MFS monocarboxylate transporter, putative [Aspergillus clavatus NRRL 1]
MESEIQLRLRPQARSITSSPSEVDNNHDEQQLPPMDGGKHAWLFLAACFMIEGLIWGFSFAFGIFQDYYSTHEPFKGSSNIAVIGTCAMGVSYLLSPITFGILLSFPRLQRWAAPAGFVTMALAIALSSFSTTTTHLIVSQGVFYGLGASIAYTPTIIFMDEWFAKRKGLAFGIMWAGTGLAGVVLPVTLQWLLDSYGHRFTLRAWAVILFVLATPLLYFVKPRVPISASTNVRPFNLTFVLDRTFLIYQAGNIIEALGYFLPTIYLPTYARSIGASSLTASLTVILLNLASVFGCIIMGTLVDRCHATTCILISTVGTVLATFLLWGFSISLAPLFIFCVAYGIFAGSFSSTWPAVSGEVRKKNPFADPSIVLGFLCSGRGIGNVVSGPLSGALLAGEPWESSAYGYGSGYGGLIVFTGITALLGGLSVLARPLKWL